MRTGERCPLLTTAAAVNEMKREEAERGYPVKIQGVVICVVSNRPAFIVQDATRAVYVVVDSANISELPQIGTYLEVEGKTDKGSFAPIVRARADQHPGSGQHARAHPADLGPIDERQPGRSVGGIQGRRRTIHPASVRLSQRLVKNDLRTPGGVLWVDLWLVGTNF